MVLLVSAVLGSISNWSLIRSKFKAESLKAQGEKEAQRSRQKEAQSSKLKAKRS
jgi:cell division protein FtsB